MINDKYQSTEKEPTIIEAKAVSSEELKDSIPANKANEPVTAGDRNLWLGLFYRTLSVSLFGVFAINNKILLNKGMPSVSVIFWGFVAAIIFSYPLFYKTEGLFKFPEKNRMLNVIRALALALANFLQIYTAKKFGVFFAVATGFATPVLNLLGAYFFP